MQRGLIDGARAGAGEAEAGRAGEGQAEGGRGDDSKLGRRGDLWGRGRGPLEATVLCALAAQMAVGGLQLAGAAMRVRHFAHFYVASAVYTEYAPACASVVNKIIR